MDFNIYAIMGILIAITGFNIVRQIWSGRAAIFDNNYTDHDRMLVSQAAFFLLLPISVLLHEGGHALLVLAFRGDIVGFGFYFFAGYVSYEARFTETQQILVAAAGTGVNILLAGGAVLTVFLKKPSFRAPINDLLITFATISLANGLIFYPLLDLATSMNGDFRQMYFGGEPWLSAIIFAIHAGVLGGGYLLTKNERIGRRLSELTGLPPHIRRGFLGGLRLAQNAQPTRRYGGQPAAGPSPQIVPTPEERSLANIATRIRAGWDAPLQAVIAHNTTSGAGLLVRWRRADGERTALLTHEPAGSMAVMVHDGVSRGGPHRFSGRVWQRWAEPPSEDEQVIGLRIAMEEADRRPPIDPQPPVA